MRPLKAPRKVRQACDACHARKVRCDGCSPCANCCTGDATCTYLAVRRKTGPKGPRRRVRSTFPIQGSAFSPRPSVISPRGNDFSKGQSQNEPDQTRNDDSAPFISDDPVAVDQFSDNVFELPMPELTDNVMVWCLDAFFKHKHPITPILHRETVENDLRTMPKTPECYSLFSSCCAVISLSPEILSPAPQSTEASGLKLPSTDFLIDEALRARRVCDLDEFPSLAHIQASFFLFSTFFCLNKDNAAWYYLREAMTMLQTMRLHEEKTYTELGDSVEATYGRRMFWTLFITERAYALQRHRPLTLRNTLSLPSATPITTDDEVLPGFLDLISLFQHFDTDFIETWNSDEQAQSRPANVELLSKLQRVLKQSLPSVLGYSEMQQADLLISRQWLKIMVWQLCVSRTLLSDGAGDESMSLQYPFTIARDAVLISHLLPKKALEANGVGILEKIFDIGCSLADLLTLSSSSGYGSTIEVCPIDTLLEIVRIMSTTLGGNYRHLNVLTDKVGQFYFLDIAPSLPQLVEGNAESPRVQEVQEEESNGSQDVLIRCREFVS